MGSTGTKLKTRSLLVEGDGSAACSESRLPCRLRMHEAEGDERRGRGANADDIQGHTWNRMVHLHSGGWNGNPRRLPMSKSCVQGLNKAAWVSLCMCLGWPALALDEKMHIGAVMGRKRRISAQPNQVAVRRRRFCPASTYATHCRWERNVDPCTSAPAPGGVGAKVTRCQLYPV